MNSEPAVLAVDGGGSKIDAALVSRDGAVLGAARWPEPVSQGFNDDGQQQIVATVKKVCADAGIEAGQTRFAQVGVFCLAGADFPVDVQRLRSVLAEHGWVAENLVFNDTLGVLRAGTDRAWGVAVVCGAGLNVTGVGPDGSIVRFPALGRLSGDWASGGSWMGTEALGSALRGQDGRGPRTSLERLIPEFFRMANPMEVVQAIYTRRMEQDRLQELPPLVVRASRDGDVVARGLLQRQAAEIVAWVAAAIRRLDIENDDVHVVLGGGVLRNSTDEIVPTVRSGIAEVAPRAIVSVLEVPPAQGAALIGLDRLEASPAAHALLRETLTQDRLTAAELASEGG